MSTFQGTESEWRSLFEQWQEALESGDREREAELWRAMGYDDGGDAATIAAWARSLKPGELSAALEQFEAVASESRVAVAA